MNITQKPPKAQYSPIQGIRSSARALLGLVAAAACTGIGAQTTAGSAAAPISGAFGPIVAALAQPTTSGAESTPWASLASMKGVRWSSSIAKASERGWIKGTLRAQPQSTWLGREVELEVRGDRSSIRRATLRSFLPHESTETVKSGSAGKTSKGYAVDLGVFAPGSAQLIRTTCDDESLVSPAFHVVVRQPGRVPLYVGFIGANGNSAMALEWTISFTERDMLAASGPGCAKL